MLGCRCLQYLSESESREKAARIVVTAGVGASDSLDLNSSCIPTVCLHSGANFTSLELLLPYLSNAHETPRPLPSLLNVSLVLLVPRIQERSLRSTQPGHGKMGQAVGGDIPTDVQQEQRCADGV